MATILNEILSVGDKEDVLVDEEVPDSIQRSGPLFDDGGKIKIGRNVESATENSKILMYKDTADGK